MSWQPKAPSYRDDMRDLIAEMRRIERSDLNITRKQWLRLARRFVAAKWGMLGRPRRMRPPSRPTR